MQPVTPRIVLLTVVWGLGAFTLIGVFSIGYVFMFNVKTDPQIFQSVKELTLFFGGLFGGMLINTRQPTPETTTTTTALVVEQPEKKEP